MTETEADGAVAEYPKILSRRESSTISSIFNEYLQLAKNEDGTATLKILQYDVLGDAADYYEENDDGTERALPDEIDGQKVVGVEPEGYIVGGQLLDFGGEELTYSFAELEDAIQWIGSEHFEVTTEVIEELRKAVAKEQR